MNKKNILKTTLLSCMLLSSSLSITGCGKEDDLKITLTAGDVTEVNPGSIIQLTSEINDPEYGLPIFKVVEGEEYATVSATGVLTVAENAPNNTTIKVKATIAGVESNVISVKVVIVEATEITISTANNNFNLERGHEASIVATITPTNATNKNVTYSITSGSEYATISANGILKINNTAPVDAQIKVKATLGTLTSNELTFTVIETEASEYAVALSHDEVLLDSTTNQASYTLQATVFDSEDRMLSGLAFNYQVVSGLEYVSVNATTGVVTPIGHGVGIVRVTVVGSGAYADCTVTSIVPPSTIKLENEYESKTRYGFSKREAMPFAVNGVGSSSNQVVANTYKYEFFLDNSTTPNSEIASYDSATQKITFADAAINHKVKIVVTSDTGATRETTRSFVVDVNNGINVRNTDELLLAQGANKTINLIGDCIVTNEEAVAANTLSKYHLRYTGNLTFYGNGHKIDLSAIEVKYDANGGDTELIKIDNSNATSDNIVKMYNLDIRGNIGVDAAYSSNKQGPWYGGYSRGLYIKGTDTNNVEAYLDSTGAKPGHSDIEMDDIKISGFKIGLKIDYAIDSEISNLVLEDNHQGGAEVSASELTFTNIRLGKNGTTGIELTPDYSKYAGENFRDSQQIKFKGTIDCSNDNDFTTPYMANDDMLKKLQQVLQMLGTTLTPAQRSAFFDTTNPGNTSINFALLIFDNFMSMDPNEQTNNTIVTFEGVTGGTYKNVAEINDADLGNYKFLSMDIVIPGDMLIQGYQGNISLGKVVVMNQNYNPNNN